MQAALDVIPLDLITTEMQPKIASIARDIIDASAIEAPLPKGIIASLDLTNAKVYDYLQTGLLNETLKIRAETELAIRSAMSKAFQEGIHPYDIARELREYTGLTANQWATVDRYEDYINKLADRIVSSDELSETALRKLERGGLRGVGAFDTRQGLTGERIEKLVDTYKNKLIAERAETIARTITIQASNEGQNALWRQAIERELIDAQEWEAEWIMADDDVTCEECQAMAEERRPVDGTYSNGVKCPPLHPQ